MVKHSEVCSAGNGGVAAVGWGGGHSALCGQQAACFGHWGWCEDHSSPAVIAGDCMARNRTGIDRNGEAKRGVRCAH